MAFTILGFAHEDITGRPLSEAFEDIYQNKLGMRSTTPNYPGTDADAIIPYNDTYTTFSYSTGFEWP
jgi:CubicO group peptidase (beta-lactamase class C family)